MAPTRRFDWLGPFYAELRSHGFSLGVAEANRVHRLLLELHAADAFPTAPNTLSNMLATVLCTNDDQQRVFRPVFLNHASVLFERPAETHGNEPVTAAAGSIGTQPASSQARRAVSQDSKRFHYRLVVAALLAYVLLMVMPVLLLKWIHAGEPRGRPPQGDARRSPDPPASPPSMPQPDAPPATQPAEPPATPLSLPWLANQLRGPLSSTEALLSAGLILATFLPFTLLAWWAASPSRRRDIFVNRRKAEAKPELFELLVSTSGYKPFDNPAVHRAVQELRRPRTLASDDLDVDGTLAETLKNAGMFTPVYARRRVAPEYPILIERQGKDDHVTHYAEGLLSTLRTSQVYCDAYYFEGDFRRVFRSQNTPRLSVDELIGRHSSHRLILITNGNGILNAVSGQVEPWAFQMTQFERRICLTPTPPELWGYREMAIAGAFDCPVLPLAAESLPLAIDVLSGDSARARPSSAPTGNGDGEAMNRLVDILEDRPGLWLSSAKPGEVLLSALEAAAREALTPEGYRWLAACAVYPELKWNLTLHLGATLQDARRKPLMRPERLLKLAVLPWFRDGSMPVWLRRRLTESMSPSEFQETQAALSRLLLSVFDFTRKTSKLSVAVEHGRPTAVQMVEQIATTLNDTLVADFMSRARPERTRFRLPTALARYLQLRRMAWTRGVSRQDPSFEEIRSNARTLRETVTRAEIGEVEVRRGEHPVFGEHAGLRSVIAFQDRQNQTVGMRDDYFLFWRPGAIVARLLDADTAMLVVQRSRVVNRMAAINFLLMVIAAFYFRNNILGIYNNDAVSVAVVCMWIVIPFFFVRFLVLHRVYLLLAEFPSFTPLNTYVHKATRFILGTE